MEDRNLPDALWNMTPEEQLRFIEAEGLELTDEQLEKVAGGDFWSLGGSCPAGGEHEWQYIGEIGPEDYSPYRYKCAKCGRQINQPFL